MTESKSWKDVHPHALKLVFRSFISTNAEEDMKLARIATLAVLTGVEWYWIEEMYSNDRPLLVEEAVRKRLH